MAAVLSARETTCPAVIGQWRWHQDSAGPCRRRGNSLGPDRQVQIILDNQGKPLGPGQRRDNQLHIPTRLPLCKCRDDIQGD
jgi:hypothetical protein